MSQSLHPDFQTNASDTEYFFLGAGDLMAAIQWSKNPALTPVGLLLSRPEQFARKWSTMLFHPEHGLSKTALIVTIDGKRYRAEHATTKVEWELTDSPGIKVEWRAGSATVVEVYNAYETARAITRTIGVRNCQSDYSMETALYGNPAIFSQFGTDERYLDAEGYDHLYLGTEDRVETNERTLTLKDPYARLIYSLDPEFTISRRAEEREKSYPKQISQYSAAEGADDFAVAVVELVRKASAGLRAAVSSGGKFDASIYQYGFEWSGDAAHIVEALVYTGQFELARSVLLNIFNNLSTQSGMLMESSRFRGGHDAELNNNGAVLAAFKLYIDWCGDKQFISMNFKKISAIAEYLLTQEHLDPKTGMLKGARDIWERSAMMGVEKGYDVSHNSFGIIGLEAAAALARTINKPHERWAEAAARMRKSFLEHPTHSFIEEGKIIKRRLMGGKPQRMVTVVETDSNKEYLATFRPKGTPMEATPLAPWEPDASTAFPICHGIVDPTSDVAKKTMASLEELWSQAWKGGGYGRYHVAAEPDSPGPWPFATAFIASAYAEIGDLEKTRRALEWLIEKAGASGSWFEFYGDRPTPPLPPTGIIVWGWAQYITLVVRHLLGAKVIDDKLETNPKIAGIKARLRFRGPHIEVGS